MNVPRAMAIVVIATVPALITGQEQPDFSGTWKCDVKRSVGCSEGSVAVIKHEGDALTMQMASGKGRVLNLKIGQTVTSENAEAAAGGGDKAQPTQVTGRWDGNVLISEVVNTADKSTATSRWRLSADGRELTIEVIRTGPNTKPSSKYVYVKTTP